MQIQVGQVPMRSVIEGLSQQIGQVGQDQGFWLCPLDIRTKACWATLERSE